MTPYEQITKKLNKLGYDLENDRDRLQFLANLVQTPVTSVIGDRKRLLKELETWIIYG
jgi:hypothetical protein